MNRLWGLLVVCGLLAACCVTAPARAASWPGVDAPPPGLNRAIAATYRIDVRYAGHGTGVCIETDSIATADHVATAGDAVLGVRADATSASGALRLRDSDAFNDVSQMKLPTDKPCTSPPLVPACELIIGEPVYAIGFPHSAFGQPEIRRGTIRLVDFHLGPHSSGQIVEGVLLLDMSTEPGMSGAGVFRERDGGLIGILRGRIAWSQLDVAFAAPVGVMMVRGG